MGVTKEYFTTPGSFIYKYIYKYLYTCICSLWRWSQNYGIRSAVTERSIPSTSLGTSPLMGTGDIKAKKRLSGKEPNHWNRGGKNVFVASSFFIYSLYIISKLEICRHHAQS